MFNNCENFEIKSSEFWSRNFVPWKEENISIGKTLLKEEQGYKTLQGPGIVTGQLLGSCIDVFPMVIGAEIWPTKSGGKIKFYY